MRKTLPILALLSGLTVLTLPRAAFATVVWQATSLPTAYEYVLTTGPAGQVIAIGDGLVHRSLDDGATWTQMGAFIPTAQARRIAYSPAGSLYASDFAFGVFRSDDDGATWSGNLVDEGCNGLAVTAQGVVLAGLTYTGNGHVHRSPDGGGSWSSIALPGSSQSSSTRCFAFGDGGEVYAGTIDGLYRSVDEGLTWQQCNDGLLGVNVRAIAVAPNQVVYMATAFTSQFDGVYRSSDRGLTWTRLDVGHPYYAEMTAAPSGEIFAVEEAGVFGTRDEGLTWTSQSSGIDPSEQLNSIIVSPSGRLFTGGSRVYRSEGVVLAVPSSDRGSVSLHGASPNPVALESRIRFDLARAGDVRLTLFDVTGRRVGVLADGAHTAGSHIVRVDARGLAAGIYVCELVAEGSRATRRLVVTR